MTISLAIAFSVAVTGPPTNSEIDTVTDALSRAFDDFGNEFEAAAIQLCPDLPPDVQAELCPASEHERAEAPPPPPPAPPPQVERIDLLLDEPPPLPPEATETDLLGGPAPPSARRGRAEPSRRATSRRASAERSTVRRSAVRTSPPRQSLRAAQAPHRPARVARAAPVAAPKPPPANGEASSRRSFFMGHVADEPPAHGAEETEEAWRDASGGHEHSYARERREEEEADEDEEELSGWERSYYWDELH